jgi:thioredoxin-related protein
VDGIEQDDAGKLVVIRLDVQSQAGRELGAAMDFRFTPTFIFIDAQGQELWRSIGQLDPKRVQESLASVP